MAKITNPWLTPLQRSYQQIKTKLIESLSNIKDKDGNTLVTDYSEGNILIIILSLFASIAEVLHYYIDNMARETFFSTARRYDSLVKHAALVDYHPAGATAASVDVVLTRASDDPSNGSTIDIPIGTSFTDSSGRVWVTTKPVKWYANTSSVILSLIQHEAKSIPELAGLVLPGAVNPVINLPAPSGSSVGTLYESTNGVYLSIDGVQWIQVNTFAYSGPNDKHFMVVVDSSQNVSIVFGNGKFGYKPEPGSKIDSCIVNVTYGANSNIPKGSITSIPQSISTKVPTAICTNPYPASGGSNYEDFNSLKTRVPMSIRTQNVAITKQDFVDLAMLHPSVSKAAIEYECGKKMNIYIAGIGGTVASQLLCQEVLKSIQDKCTISTWLSVKTVGVSDIILDIDVIGKRGFSNSDIHNSILSALYETYSPANSDIGRGIRLSDVYALIDNLPTVDYLRVNKLYTKPWPKTIFGNSSLMIDSYNLSASSIKPVEYIITFSSQTEYSLISKDGKYRSGKVLTGTSQTFTDDIHGTKFSLTILGTYQSGYKYSIVISELQDDDFSLGYNLAVFTDPSQLTANISETV